MERDLLYKMLAKNPAQRWSATELLKHKFFASSDDYIESEIDFPRMNNMAM